MLQTRRFPILGFACVSLCWGCPSSSSKSAAPGLEWTSAPPEEQGFDSAALAAVIEQIDEQDLPIDSIQVVRKGVLILDAYFYPYLGDRKHDIASVTKSVTSTLIGIAVDRGLLTLDQGLLATLPELAPPPSADGKAEIDLLDLLTMTSGLRCGLSPGEPELYQTLQSENFVRYALELPMAAPPGTQWAYCSPGSHLLSAMIAKASRMSTLDFAMKNLFGPLGITDVTWPADPQGVTFGWGDLQLHPRDMARIGQLFLNEGSWNGAQIVSKHWVEQASESFILTDDGQTGYGYQWWVLSGPFDGVYEARGRSGQAIIVWPQNDVVAVFTGRGLDVREEVAPLLVEALKSDSPLDPNPVAYARLSRAIQDATKPPSAQPVPGLPPLAVEVSGKVYQLAENELSVRCISLRFPSPFDPPYEVWFDLTHENGTFELPVGMDGVPRFSETGPRGIAIGALGEWNEDSVFSMQYDEVAGPTHLRIRGDFGASAESVELEFTDASGYFPPQTVQGSRVERCD